MKNLFKIVGIILIVAIIGFSFATCKTTCETCGGTGKCTTCEGTGKYGGIFECTKCIPNGSGKCRDCSGEGWYF